MFFQNKYRQTTLFQGEHEIADGVANTVDIDSYLPYLSVLIVKTLSASLCNTLNKPTSKFEISVVGSVTPSACSVIVKLGVEWKYHNNHLIIAIIFHLTTTVSAYFINIFKIVFAIFMLPPTNTY